MKIITIGRDDNCNIVIEDAMISRRHAVVRLHPTGRIELIDHSQNGTSVNGVKVGNGKIVRIKRGDSVVFAGNKPLDWKDIPDPSKPLKIALWSIVTVVAAILLLWAFIAVRDAIETRNEPPTPEIIDIPGNKVEVVQQDTVRPKEDKPEKVAIKSVTTGIPQELTDQHNRELKRKEREKKDQERKKSGEQTDKKNKEKKGENDSKKDGRKIFM
ncbi:MAG: FHA domain-containing protein [Pseudoflavonifractor sp.]|nr:FHA domain-containing protein [Alloprevotella sp.]MCM1116862.1 FHA domain-containing protein [Pseudoflavonifractor sp.]